MFGLGGWYSQYFSHGSSRSSFHRPQCGLSVILEYPSLSSGIVIQQLLVLAVRHRSRPYNSRLIDVGIVKYPFVVNIMLRAVANEYKGDCQAPYLVERGQDRVLR